MNVGMILISHGEFAKAALGSAEMIAGPQEQIIALALTEDKSLESLESEIADAYQTLIKENDQVLALCDIYGGTPFNALLRTMLKGTPILAYTGLSLPLLIDLIFSRNMMNSIDELKNHILETQNMVLKEIELPSLDDEDEED